MRRRGPYFLHVLARTASLESFIQNILEPARIRNSTTKLMMATLLKDGPALATPCLPMPLSASLLIPSAIAVDCS